MTLLILGCGYTGRRVAQRFLARGATVIATTRDPASLQDLAREGVEVLAFDAARPGRIAIPEGTLVLDSIPEYAPGIAEWFSGRPGRMLYLSTTGVYGAIRDVDEHTAASALSERERRRVATEEEVRRGPWSSLVLRPAAIYGRGRGVHVAMREGRFQLAGGGDNFVSRIHVDDLAAHVEAGLLSDVSGAWPVADDLPCTSREIAEFCSRLLDVPMPQSVSREALPETRRGDRRVDGRAIRNRLGIELRYPSYREGIPASL